MVPALDAKESSAVDNDIIVVPRQIVKVAVVLQLLGSVGQRKEGHAVPCKADADIQ
jgi:hypothetical protein